MKSFRYLLLGVTLLFVPHAIFGQTQISGIIQLADGEKLPFANVLLLSTGDSSLVKGEVSDANGAYLFEEVAVGEYLLMASMVGYLESYSEPFKLIAQSGKKEMSNLVLNENVAQLNTVEVVAQKPLFEQKIDRLVVNVEGSITAAGATALEVLERSPGVVVDYQNNGLSIAGKSGVVVMINGKINRMPLNAVVQMLAGMPSSNIEKIELITTPPSSFDAEGNAGYINIVLKQTSDLGLNGSYTLSGGYGNGDIFSGGTNFNYRKGDFNLFGDYSFSRDARNQYAEFNRSVLLNGEDIGTNTITDREPVQRNHNVRLGMDLNLGEKSVFGILVSTYDNRWSMDALNTSTLSTNSIPDTLLRIDSDEVNQWRHFGGNLNFQHNFRKDESLTFNADYLRYDNENPTNYLNSYSDGGGDFLFEETTFSGKVTPIEVGVGSVDYTKRFSENLNLEAGLKGTISRFDNDVSVFRLVNGTRINDPNLTAEYRLEENIGAAYTAFNVKLDQKSDLKIGLRYEYTDSNLGTVEEANIVDRQFGRFFPSLFLSRKFSDNHSTNFSYSRRITRPTFNDMAPFVIFVDPYTFFSGNPALQPAIADNATLSYRFKTALLSIQYTVEDSAITGFQPMVIEGTNQQLLGATNMENRKTATFTAAFPVGVTPWWRMQNNFTGNWQEVNAYFDEDPVRVRTKNFQFIWINTFTLPQDFSAELVGIYYSKALNGTAETIPVRAINVGIQKKFSNEAGTLRFGVDDVFNTLRFGFISNFPEYNLVSEARLRFRYRTVKLTYSRNFGNSQLRTARQRATGAEAERQRVN